MSKPKEFWIAPKLINPIDPVEPSYFYAYDLIGDPKRLEMHVIEYSAFESLQQENAKLKEAVEVMQEALKFYSKIEHFEKVVWENDDKSGPCEPYDFEENELIERYSNSSIADFGIFAEEALEKVKELLK
jgi:hypothetical protein